MNNMMKARCFAKGLHRPLSRTSSSQAMNYTPPAFLSPADVQIKCKTLCEPSTASMASLPDAVRNDLIYSLSLSSDATFSSLNLTDMQREQLQKSEHQTHIGEKQHRQVDTDSLPRTLEDALRHSRRAIVVTQANPPYAVIDVNTAWENLCGYSYLESKGKSLGDLLQGPATDIGATTALMNKLLQGEEVGTTLTNYTKSGRAFRNRLRAGPLLDGDRVTHFVGVLQEVSN